MKVKTIKFSEDNIGRYLHDVGNREKNFKDKRAIIIKQNNDNFDPMRIKNFCTLKGTIKGLPWWCSG